MNIREFINDYFHMSRYIALGSLDGILAVMGVTLAASGVVTSVDYIYPTLVIGITGLSGGVALSLSNAFGAFIGERAEEFRNIRELEHKMMLDEGKLDDTVIHDRLKEEFT